MSFLSNSYQAPSMVPVTMCVDQFNSAWLANGESQQSFGANKPVFEQMCSQTQNPTFATCSGSGVYSYSLGGNCPVFCTQTISSNLYCPNTTPLA